MKSFLVIGAGKFGHFICRYLYNAGCEIMLVDESENKVSDLVEYVSSAKIGDCTRRDVLMTFGVDEFDAAIVCIPEDFQDSLQIVDLLKEIGCPYVIAIASTEVQAKFFLKNGADKIVFPEKDMAQRLAKTISNDSVFDYFMLSDEYAMFELRAPSKWFGKTIQIIDVRKRYGVNVVAAKTPEGKLIAADANYMFNPDDHIIVLGGNDAFKKLIG